MASYSAQGLAAAGLPRGATIQHDGLTFAWPDVPPGEPDNTATDGQVIAVSGRGSKLGFLGASAFGIHSGTVYVTYADDTIARAQLGFADWYDNAPIPGTDIVATSPWNVPEGVPDPDHPVSVYYGSIPLDPSRDGAVHHAADRSGPARLLARDRLLNSPPTMRRSEQRRAAVFALYQHDLTGRPLDELFAARSGPFTRALAHAAADHAADLDVLIERHARNWTLDRIAPLEKAILRTALLEMLHPELVAGEKPIPAEGAIDEAVETAKAFCGADAPSFVNGILGAALREARQNGSPHAA